MPKSFVLGNGDIQVGLDKFGQVHDFFFPYVGLENHAGGDFIHKLGIWIDGNFSWLQDGSWQIEIDGSKDTMVSDIKAHHPGLEITLHFRDVVYNEKNIFLREIKFQNHSQSSRSLKFFTNQQFGLYDSARGDTAYYYPVDNTVIHYEGRRIALINGRHGANGFSEFSVGLMGIEGLEGTFKDAEDGELSGNGIEHGSVDSVVALTIELGGGAEETAYYWITIAKTLIDARELNNQVLDKTPKYIIDSTEDYWRAWVNKTKLNFANLSPESVNLYKSSLLIVRAHIDNRGGVIASGDSDLLKNGRATYNFVWLRDASFIIMAMDKAGYPALGHRFFEWCRDTLMPEGYFMQKYRPDRSLGSSWHPWIKDGQERLPVQEDETALVIVALWEHYKVSGNLEFIEEIYNPLIKRASNWMVEYIDPENGLPKPSYDLWEAKFGVHTFTASATYAALIAASRFAEILNKKGDIALWRNTAEKIKEGIKKYLYDPESKFFYKSIKFIDGEQIIDKTIDMSSIYGIYKFGVFDYNSNEVKLAIKVAEAKLINPCGVSGLARYENDKYFNVNQECLGNPWVITSMWLAQYYIAIAKTKKDFEQVERWIEWANEYAHKSGVLSEQLNPHTGEQLSASPLTWSHGEYIVTLLQYMEKMEELGIADMYKPMN